MKSALCRMTEEILALAEGLGGAESTKKDEHDSPRRAPLAELASSSTHCRPPSALLALRVSSAGRRTSPDEEI